MSNCHLICVPVFLPISQSDLCVVAEFIHNKKESPLIYYLFYLIIALFSEFFQKKIFDGAFPGQMCFQIMTIHKTTAQRTLPVGVPLSPHSWFLGLTATVP